MRRSRHLPIVFLLVPLFLVQCKNKQAVAPAPEKDIVVKPASLPERVTADLKHTIHFLKDNKGMLNDSVDIGYPSLIDSLYDSHQYQAFWFNDDKWKPVADSLFAYLDSAELHGLFPQDYHSLLLKNFRQQLQKDTNARKNAALYARADIMMSDALLLLSHDLKRGRLPFDSVTLRKDTVLSDSFYAANFDAVMKAGAVDTVLRQLEPKLAGYDSLIAYLPAFLHKAKFTTYTYLKYPYDDSVAFFRLLAKRLHETGNYQDSIPPDDTTAFKKVITRYQNKYGFNPTGHISDPLIDKLNNTDQEKFRRIAITLDRYKLLPDTLPAVYAWVNLPAFQLSVFDDDTVTFQSKVIVGNPKTRTPVLTSEISNFITMPQWTVPYSIFYKEILPKIKEDTSYLTKQNLMVVNDRDSVLDPRKIKWSKYKKEKNNFSYQIKQREGDDNSLGVIKFNFRNKYSVYLHDTNVRGMFARSNRAISHGCVRVKEWNKMADFLVRNDTLKFPADTLTAWISRKEKHLVGGFRKVPIFIRYFSIEGREGKLRFYDDIYDEDRYLSQKYFYGKVVL